MILDLPREIKEAIMKRWNDARIMCGIILAPLESTEEILW